MAPGSAASAAPGTFLGIQLLGLHPDLLNQKLEEWGPAPCLNTHGSDASSSLRSFYSFTSNICFSFILPPRHHCFCLHSWLHERVETLENACSPYFTCIYRISSPARFLCLAYSIGFLGNTLLYVVEGIMSYPNF